MTGESRDARRERDLALVLLRVVAGGLMLVLHGLPKLGKVLAGQWQFPDPLGLGAAPSLVLAMLAEVGAASLVIVGLATRAACVPVLVTMAVAVFVQQADKALEQRELGLLYLAGFGAILLLGPGGWSIDAVVARARGRRRG